MKDYFMFKLSVFSTHVLHSFFFFFFFNLNFIGSLRRRIIYLLGSQFALQALVLSMLFQKESCHPSVHLMWRQIAALKMTVVKQVLLKVHPAHRQVIILQLRLHFICLSVM